ncbi:MAG: hypothetical protein U0M96_02465 [Eggerthellaceae bacterium]
MNPVPGDNRANRFAPVEKFTFLLLRIFSHALFFFGDLWQAGRLYWCELARLVLTVGGSAANGDDGLKASQAILRPFSYWRQISLNRFYFDG